MLTNTIEAAFIAQHTQLTMQPLREGRACIVSGLTCGLIQWLTRKRNVIRFEKALKMIPPLWEVEAQHSHQEQT